MNEGKVAAHNICSEFNVKLRDLCAKSLSVIQHIPAKHDPELG
jgi:hypothetical protein